MLQTDLVQGTPDLSALRVKIFADGADKASMLRLMENRLVVGFTTNPTLMHKIGIQDYEAFARDLLQTITNHPISFEVFADDAAEMGRQARRIASWGNNVYVKIPVTNTQRVSMSPLIKQLSSDGVKLNVTALMTLPQVEEVTEALAHGAPSCISVFAGRVADTGRDPIPLMREAVTIMAPHRQMELIWASPRELLNVFHADACGVHIITVTHDVLAKLDLVAKNLDEYSLETVKMFHQDARRAGFQL